MILNNFKIVLLVVFIGLQYGSAQISPGTLYKGHAGLEGISNCTKCHDLARKVSNEKCLGCHIEVADRLNANKGYHSSIDVKGKDCYSCHSDHHGANFEIVHFDKKSFNHSTTGYDLTGEHQKIDCKECHTKQFISKTDIRKKEFTFLGLIDKCNNCHEDAHQNTLSKDCKACHNTVHFKPAVSFDHKTTSFALKGKHQTVDCKECHKSYEMAEMKNKIFTIEKFGQCNTCHEDVHRRKFGSECATCHNEQSFQSIGKINLFNHNVTEFTLKGRHRRLECSACHKSGVFSLQVAFQEFKNKDFQLCTSCHEDIHENKFGQNCIECHSEESFKINKIMEGKFDHDLTNFKLEGLHTSVDCKACHKEKLTDALAYSQCIYCHKTDKHEVFVSEVNSPIDCKECHHVNGFKETSFSIESHQKTAFPLEGSHLAVACLECHLKDSKLRFKNLEKDCISCHKDIHKNLLPDKYYPQQECKNCHTTVVWSDVAFDHNLTNWPLEGKHMTLNCNKCHGDKAVNLMKDSQNQKNIQFTLGSNECYSCHKDVHQGQFASKGVTDCSKCHAFGDWSAVKFHHENAAFSLEGAHKKVACDQCHKTFSINTVSCVKYKLESFKCIDCHL